MSQLTEKNAIAILSAPIWSAKLVFGPIAVKDCMAFYLGSSEFWVITEEFAGGRAPDRLTVERYKRARHKALGVDGMTPLCDLMLASLLAALRDFATEADLRSALRWVSENGEEATDRAVSELAKFYE